MPENDQPERSERALQEGQQPPRHFVKSLFGSAPEIDPFGDKLSVYIQVPPGADGQISVEAPSSNQDSKPPSLASEPDEPGE